MDAKLVRKCKNVKLLMIDVDGVLTDGGMYYTNKGDVMKKFQNRDGMGVTLLRKNNIPTVIVTKEKTLMVRRWATKMKIKKVYDGVRHKELIIDKIHNEFDVLPDEMAYIGDDVNDLELMKRVGFSATPNNGIDEAKKTADYICTLKGGEGAVREIADLILKIKFPKKTKWY